MSTYDVCVMVHGVVRFSVEASSESEAESLAWDDPRVPDVEKLYDAEVSVLKRA